MRPITTLFLIESVDGKINSGSNDYLDVDKDWCRIDGVKEGLQQYYDIEQNISFISFNTGRVMAKIGVNERERATEKLPCTFIILDNKPHLNEKGISYLASLLEKLILVTTNSNHPAYQVKKTNDNIDILYYEEFQLSRLLEDLGNKYLIKNLIVQSGGTMNGLFLRENLIDYVHLVIAPLLVGGKDTSTLIDGESITKIEELDKLKCFELLECKVLENSYLELFYKVRK